MHNAERKEFISPCLKRILRGRKRNAFVNSGQVISVLNFFKRWSWSDYCRVLVLPDQYRLSPPVRLLFYRSEPTGSDYLSDKALLPSIKFWVVPQREIFGIVVDWGTTVQGGKSWVLPPLGSLRFFIELIIPATLCPWG